MYIWMYIHINIMLCLKWLFGGGTQWQMTKVFRVRISKYTYTSVCKYAYIQYIMFWGGTQWQMTEVFYIRIGKYTYTSVYKYVHTQSIMFWGGFKARPNCESHLCCTNIYGNIHVYMYMYVCASTYMYVWVWI